MNFQSISYFIVLAREKNFTRAAEKLHMTQQALSASIASLEKEWGIPFFFFFFPLYLEASKWPLSFVLYELFW